MNRITIQTIPHAQQRYETCGDWEPMPDGSMKITVSEMDSEDSEFLVALHEMIEAYLCKRNGITDEEVTEFDKAFEAHRERGNTDEPGDHESAPYRRHHRTATLIEMLVADAMDFDWKQHEKNVNAL